MPSIVITYAAGPVASAEAAALAQRAAIAVARACAAGDVETARAIADSAGAPFAEIERLTLIANALQRTAFRHQARARRWKAVAKRLRRAHHYVIDRIDALRDEWRNERHAVDDVLAAYGVALLESEPIADGIHALVARLACEAEHWRTTALHLAPAPVALAQHVADVREAALFGEVAK